MSKNSSLKRLIGLSTWLILVTIAFAFLLRWRGEKTPKPNDKD